MAEKTNAVRKLDTLKAKYALHSYEGVVSGVDVAAVMGQDVSRVFKTLVTVGKSGGHYVFMIPVAEELDLKKAASLVREKSVEMLKSKDLLPLTGYIHGGCSPIGMKKVFPTVVHETARELDVIFFSAGKIGLQIETSPAVLEKAVKLTYGDLIVAK